MTLQSCIDRIKVWLEDLGCVDVVSVDPLVIRYGISHPMYQIPSFPTYILVVQDLFDLVLIVRKRYALPYRVIVLYQLHFIRRLTAPPVSLA